MCYLVPVAGLLTAGGAIGKISGLLIAMLLVVIATPLVGFTINARSTPALLSLYYADAPNSWVSLTDAERAWLLAVARDEAFPAGTVLCRQDAQARHLFFIVEERPAELASRLAGIASERPDWSGLNCSIFLADITGFGGHRRNDTDRRFLRASMYAILQRAFETSGVPWSDCYREDRGDGVLIIVPPATPTCLLVDPLSGGLAASLADHNGQSAEAVQIQLRVALHVGPVVSDPEGVSGESIILAARMLDAPVLKRQLAAEAADLGLIVSTYVYDTVVKHTQRPDDPAQYRQVKVQLKESRLSAWICLMGGSRS